MHQHAGSGMLPAELLLLLVRSAHNLFTPHACNVGWVQKASWPIELMRLLKPWHSARLIVSYQKLCALDIGLMVLGAWHAPAGSRC